MPREGRPVIRTALGSSIAVIRLQLRWDAAAPLAFLTIDY